jgi:hypothetical protein
VREKGKVKLVEKACLRKARRLLKSKPEYTM